MAVLEAGSSSRRDTAEQLTTYEIYATINPHLVQVVLIASTFLTPSCMVDNDWPSSSIESRDSSVLPKVGLLDVKVGSVEMAGLRRYQ